MSDTVNAILLNADYFILMLFRVGGLIVSSPIFGRVNIPNMAKIGFACAISFLFFYTIPPQGVIEYNSLISFLLVCLAELLLGIALAFVTNLFFSITFTAGQLIDMQIGFGIVNVYDIQNNTQIPMVGNMLNIIMLITFFLMNGHHRLIEIIYRTVQVMPVGQLTISPDIGWLALEIFSRTFLLGIMVAMPVIASGLILEFTFGALVRTVPQMNMFVVGVPMKILIGFFILFTLIPMFVSFSDTLFAEMFKGVEQMFSTFVGVS